jgi:hypothetical protein
MNAVQESETPSGGWHFFDAAYCISLASRPDRRATAAKQFKAVGLQDRVEFVIVEEHPTDNEQGIFESHLLCMAKGLAAGARRILIFEDDIVFRGYGLRKLMQITTFLSQNDRCRLFFLGCLVSGSQPASSPGILEVDYRALTHAYVIESSLARELATQKWQQKPFDVVLAEVPEEKFAHYPSFAFQSNSPSDNARLKKLERIRRLCGGLGFIQKMNERYYRHKGIILAGHLLLLAALLWLYLW